MKALKPVPIWVLLALVVILGSLGASLQEAQAAQVDTQRVIVIVEASQLAEVERTVRVEIEPPHGLASGTGVAHLSLAVNPGASIQLTARIARIPRWLNSLRIRFPSQERKIRLGRTSVDLFPSVKPGRLEKFKLRYLLTVDWEKFKREGKFGFLNTVYKIVGDQ